MKTNFRKIISVVALVAVATSAALISCSKDEVTSVPEEVVTTIEQAYYISGVVTSADGLLSGVAVTSGSESATTDSEGVYSLKMSSAAQAAVNFAKDGYVSIDATAIFESGATSGAIVTLSQELTAKVEAQEAVVGEENVLAFDDLSGSEIVISIPAEALTETIEIAVTDYVAVATPSAVETMASAETSGAAEVITGALASVDLEPSGTTFEVPVTISIPSDYVEGAYHAKLVDGEWTKQGEAVYNTQTSAFEIQVDGFSQHAIAMDSEVKVSSNSSSSYVTLASETFDNIGQVNAVTQTVSYNQYTGWELVSGSTLSNYVASIMGSSEGVQTFAGSLDVNVAGDQKVTVIITQQVTTTTFDTDAISAVANSYGSITVSISTEEGDLRPDHNV